MFGIRSIQFALPILSKSLRLVTSQFINMSPSLVWQNLDVGGDETEIREKTVENREKERFRFSGKNRSFGFVRFP
jgi:hypothetical protein